MTFATVNTAASILSDETVDTVACVAESEQAYQDFRPTVYSVRIGDVVGAVASVRIGDIVGAVASVRISDVVGAVATLRPAYRQAEAARGNPEASHPPR